MNKGTFNTVFCVNYSTKRPLSLVFGFLFASHFSFSAQIPILAYPNGSSLRYKATWKLVTIIPWKVNSLETSCTRNSVNPSSLSDITSCTGANKRWINLLRYSNASVNHLNQQNQTPMKQLRVY